MSTISSNPSLFHVQEKLAELEAGLLQTQPNIKDCLRLIHTKLKQDPDIVTLLTEEQCSILVRGLKKQTQVEIATKAVKAKPKKKLTDLAADDL